jgi:hypothetical protein
MALIDAPPRPAPQTLVRNAPARQAALPLASNGVQRWLWESRFGAILIEVAGDDVFVNGQRVVPHRP